MRIGDRDTEVAVIIVAEIGNNHEGDIEVALELVERVAVTGADAVKLQVFSAERFVRPGESERLAQLSRFELSIDEVKRVATSARRLGLAFAATPLDLPTVSAIESFVDCLKIASGDNDFVPLLDAVAATGRPAMVSSGLTDLEGIRRAKLRLESGGADIAVLHCVSAYPASPASLNLAAIPMLREELGCTIGYSDHALGSEAAVAAVALGARVIEKHVTLNRAQSEFRDHAISAEPEELAAMIARIRLVEEMSGTAVEEVQDAETALVVAARRAIVAARTLPVGHEVRLEDITWMRPRDGLEPGREDEVVGHRLTRSVEAGQALLPEAFG